MESEQKKPDADLESHAEVSLGVDSESHSSLQYKKEFEEEEEEEEEEEDKIVEKSHNGRFHKRNKRFPKQIEGVDKTFVAIEPKSGKEVIWNERLLPEKKTERENRLMSIVKKLKRHSHPFLVRYLDAWITKGDTGPRKLVVITERLDEGTLKQFLCNSTRTNVLWRRHVGQLLSVLLFLHRLGVTHGNLTKETIFYQNSGSLKVGPFVLNEFFGQKAASSDILGLGLVALEIAAWDQKDDSPSISPADRLTLMLDRLENPHQRNFIETSLDPNPATRPKIKSLLSHLAITEVPTLKLLSAKVVVDTLKSVPAEEGIPSEAPGFAALLKDYLSHLEDETVIVELNFQQDNITNSRSWKDFRSNFTLTSKYLENVKNGFYPFFGYRSQAAVEPEEEEDSSVAIIAEASGSHATTSTIGGNGTGTATIPGTSAMCSSVSNGPSVATSRKHSSSLGATAGLADDLPNPIGRTNLANVSTVHSTGSHSQKQTSDGQKVTATEPGKLAETGVLGATITTGKRCEGQTHAAASDFTSRTSDSQRFSASFKSAVDSRETNSCSPAPWRSASNVPSTSCVAAEQLASQEGREGGITLPSDFPSLFRPARQHRSLLEHKISLPTDVSLGQMTITAQEHRSKRSLCQLGKSDLGMSPACDALQKNRTNSKGSDSTISSSGQGSKAQFSAQSIDPRLLQHLSQVPGLTRNFSAELLRSNFHSGPAGGLDPAAISLLQAQLAGPRLPNVASKVHFPSTVSHPGEFNADGSVVEDANRPSLALSSGNVPEDDDDVDEDDDDVDDDDDDEEKDDDDDDDEDEAKGLPGTSERLEAQVVHVSAPSVHPIHPAVFTHCQYFYLGTGRWQVYVQMWFVEERLKREGNAQLLDYEWHDCDRIADLFEASKSIRPEDRAGLVRLLALARHNVPFIEGKFISPSGLSVNPDGLNTKQLYNKLVAVHLHQEARDRMAADFAAVGQKPSNQAPQSKSKSPAPAVAVPAERMISDAAAGAGSLATNGFNKTRRASQTSPSPPVDTEYGPVTWRPGVGNR